MSEPKYIIKITPLRSIEMTDDVISLDFGRKQKHAEKKGGIREGMSANR